MSEPVQGKGHPLALQAREYCPLVVLQWPGGCARRRERVSADTRQNRHQVGHVSAAEDLVEALEARRTKAPRVVPGAIVGELVDPDQEAWRTVRALTEQRASSGQ